MCSFQSLQNIYNLNLLCNPIAMLKVLWPFWKRYGWKKKDTIVCETGYSTGCVRKKNPPGFLPACLAQHSTPLSSQRGVIGPGGCQGQWWATCFHWALKKVKGECSHWPWAPSGSSVLLFPKPNSSFYPATQGPNRTLWHSSFKD